MIFENMIQALPVQWNAVARVLRQKTISVVGVQRTVLLSQPLQPIRTVQSTALKCFLELSSTEWIAVAARLPHHLCGRV